MPQQVEDSLYKLVLSFSYVSSKMELGTLGFITSTVPENTSNAQVTVSRYYCLKKQPLIFAEMVFQIRSRKHTSMPETKEGKINEVK